MAGILTYKNNKGSILLFALWVLAFLTIFAVQIGLSIRAKISLISRIEQRSQLHYLAQAGIKKAISALRLDLQQNSGTYTVDSKLFRHNNSSEFSAQKMGSGVFEVSYEERNSEESGGGKYFGLIDEERKINLNTAEPEEIRRIIKQALLCDDDKATELTEAIIDWREYGVSKPNGFYSDDYYANLEDPYTPKDYEFESLDELLLVEGIDQDAYQKLLAFVTIFGQGQVNINTASIEVLIALGLDEVVAGKLIAVRSGNDGFESTFDDFIFYKTFDIASTVKSFVGLTNEQIKQIDYLNARGKITTSSFYYFIRSAAYLDNSHSQLTALAVYNTRENRIEYWREKY